MGKRSEIFDRANRAPGLSPARRDGQARRRLPQALCVSLVAGLLCGCGSQPGPSVSLVKVSGHVTLDGKPLTKGTVSFMPDAAASAGSLNTSAGDIGPDGKFTLSTFKKGDGVQAGTYKVAVVAYDVEPTEDEECNLVPGKPAIPNKYFDPQTSEITVTVKPGESKQEVPIELKKS